MAREPTQAVEAAPAAAAAVVRRGATAAAEPDNDPRRELSSQNEGASTSRSSPLYREKYGTGSTTARFAKLALLGDGRVTRRSRARVDTPGVVRLAQAPPPQLSDQPAPSRETIPPSEMRDAGGMCAPSRPCRQALKVSSTAQLLPHARSRAYADREGDILAKPST